VCCARQPPATRRSASHITPPWVPCAFVSVVMDFEAGPAGVQGAALLAHRGADHEVEVPAGHSFNVSLGNTLDATPLGGGNVAIPYSGVGGVMPRILFTSDAAVLNALLTGEVPHPNKYEAAWAYATANALDASSAWGDCDDSHARLDAWVAGIDVNAIPAALMVTGADMHPVDTSVAAGSDT
jgi:hypothetical protein